MVAGRPSGPFTRLRSSVEFTLDTSVGCAVISCAVLHNLQSNTTRLFRLFLRFLPILSFQVECHASRACAVATSTYPGNDAPESANLILSNTTLSPLEPVQLPAIFWLRAVPECISILSGLFAHCPPPAQSTQYWRIALRGRRGVVIGSPKCFSVSRQAS